MCTVSEGGGGILGQSLKKAYDRKKEDTSVYATNPREHSDAKKKPIQKTNIQTGTTIGGKY